MTRTTTEHGFTILKQKAAFRLRDTRIVLAELPPQYAHRWVTWAMNDQGQCWWGHYCLTLDDAEADFAVRR